MSSIGIPELLVILGILGLLAIVAAVVVVLLVRRGGAGQTSAAGRSKALEILRERYARGELTRDEYAQRRRDLEGQGGSPEDSS